MTDNQSEDYITEYCGVRYIEGSNEDNDERNYETIVKNTTNLIECIREVKSIRKNDISRFKREFQGNFSTINECLKNGNILHYNFIVNYYIFVYKQKNCGHSLIKDICQDKYKELDESESDDEKELNKGNIYSLVKTEKYELFNKK